MLFSVNMSSCDSSQVKDITIFPFRLRADYSNSDRVLVQLKYAYLPERTKETGGEYGVLVKGEQD